MGNKNPANKLTQKQYEDRFYKLFLDFEIVSEYKGMAKPIKIRHQCGFEFEVNARSPLDNKTLFCPVCSNKHTKIYHGVNDIKTTNQKLYNLLVNKTDGEKYSSNSKEKIEFHCINCNHIINKAPINIKTDENLLCDECKDGISYFEKFFMNLLKQLNINYIRQYHPSWGKPYYYDFYFEYKTCKYIVECDGGLGHGYKQFDNSIDVIGLKRDKIKDQLAKEQNILVVRIPCIYTNLSNRYEIFVNAIKKSYLSQLFNLEQINFQECNQFATSSIIKAIAMDWINGIRSYLLLAQKYNISKDTVRNYIKICCEANLIPETYSEVKSVTSNKGRIYQKVKCVQTGEIFNNYSEPRIKYEAYLSIYFNKNFKYSGKLPDGTKLSWIKI